MAQDYLKFNGVQVKEPDEDGYSVNLSTTSTEDSGRNQYLSMRNTPIGTVASYSLKWSSLTADEMSLILKQVLGKAKFQAHYFDIVEGTWKDGDFYATTYNSPSKCLKEGEEVWDELSFNMIGVNAI